MEVPILFLWAWGFFRKKFEIVVEVVFEIAGAEL